MRRDHLVSEATNGHAAATRQARKDWNEKRRREIDILRPGPWTTNGTCKQLQIITTISRQH